MAHTETYHPRLISYTDNLDMKEVLRPKTVDPSEFVSVMRRWLAGQKIKDPARRYEILSASAQWERDPNFAQAARTLMNHLPLQQDQLANIPELLPPHGGSHPTKSLPPFMKFGWVVTKDEIEQLGKARNLCVEEGILEFYPSDDPDRPKEAVYDEESDCYKYDSEPPTTFSPRQTLDALLTEGKAACGLYLEDYRAYNWQHFTISRIRDDFGKCFEDTLFIKIYTNIDLLKKSRRGPASRSKVEMPGPTEIKAMQEWLGLGKDREPGWWFSSALWNYEF